jgi:hypothetical protein
MRNEKRNKIGVDFKQLTTLNVVFAETYGNRHDTTQCHVFFILVLGHVVVSSKIDPTHLSTMS